MTTIPSKDRATVLRALQILRLKARADGRRSDAQSYADIRWLIISDTKRSKK